MCSFLHAAPRFCFLNELERDLGLRPYRRGQYWVGDGCGRGGKGSGMFRNLFTNGGTPFSTPSVARNQTEQTAKTRAP